MSIKKRSQLGISDIFFASTILLVLIGAIFFVYNNYSVKFESRHEFNRMQLSALQLTDMLVKSSGEPDGWENNSSMARVIGLAYKGNNGRNISPQKVESFVGMNYTMAKEILGTDYDFYFRMTGTEGTIMAEKGLKSEGTQAVSIERRVMYRENDTILSFVLWK